MVWQPSLIVYLLRMASKVLQWWRETRERHRAIQLSQGFARRPFPRDDLVPPALGDVQEIAGVEENIVPLGSQRAGKPCAVRDIGVEFCVDVARVVEKGREHGTAEEPALAATQLHKPVVC